MNSGAEIAASHVYYTSQPILYAQDWYRYAIHNDPTWSTADPSQEDIVYAPKKNPYNIETWNSDLSGFQNKGGKILHYHDLTDAVITSDNSPRYYIHVSKVTVPCVMWIRAYAAPRGISASDLLMPVPITVVA
jgi:feruloyl esterase